MVSSMKSFFEIVILFFGNETSSLKPCTQVLDPQDEDLGKYTFPYLLRCTMDVTLAGPAPVHHPTLPPETMKLDSTGLNLICLYVSKMY